MKQFFEHLADVIVAGVVAIGVLISIVLSASCLLGTGMETIRAGIAGCCAWLGVSTLTLLWKLK